jgi:hypothetical protein
VPKKGGLFTGGKGMKGGFGKGGGKGEMDGKGGFAGKVGCAGKVGVPEVGNYLLLRNLYIIEGFRKNLIEEFYRHFTRIS